MRKRMCALLLVLCLALNLSCQGLDLFDLTVTSPLDFTNLSLFDRSGRGWSWNAISQTLVLSDGLRVQTGADAITLPEGSTLQVRGTVEITAGSRDSEGETLQRSNGIVMGAGSSLIIPSGASLKISATGDGIQTDALELKSGTLDITSQEGSCLHATTGDIVLEAGTGVELTGAGSAITADKGKVSLAGAALLTAEARGISAGAGSGDRVTVFEGADITVRCAQSDAIGIEAGGDVRLEGTLDLTSGGAGLLAQGSVVGEDAAVTIRSAEGDGLTAAGEVALTGGTLTIAQAGGDGLTAGDRIALTGATVALGQVDGEGVVSPQGFTPTQSTLTLSSAGGSGLTTQGDIVLTASTLSLGKVEGYGVRTVEGVLTVDPDSTLSVTSAGEDGVWASGLITVDGSLTVSQAAGQGLTCDQAGVRINGTAQVTAQGNGVSAQLGITCAETGLLQVEAGGDGVISRSGGVTLLARPGEEASVTAGGDGVVSADKVIISRPGIWSIDAGNVGIRAAGDVTVGGAEEGACDLSIASGMESIWSDHGNVLMGPCSGMYFFDGGIHVDSDVGKTVSVLEGAGLLYGMRNGFAVGIVRKDCTITADMTPELIQLRTFQIGAGHTVTVAAGAKVKLGPLILGKNAFLKVESGSEVYYNGPTTQVTGTVQNYATVGMDLTTGGGSLPKGASWDSGSKTLTLNGTVVDLTEGPVLKLPAGSTIRLTGATSRLSAGSKGTVIQGMGDLTITGGVLEVSGGAVGIETAGALRLTGATVEVKGASEASLSAASITGTNSDVTIYGSGVAARATQGDIVFDSLSAPAYYTAVQGRYTLLMEAGGTAATVVQVPAGGGTPDTVTTEERVNPDGTITTVKTDTVTGVVNETTTASDGTVTVVQTRPDGVASTVTAAPDGTTTASVTLPEGVDQAVVALEVPGATATTVAQLVREDGSSTVLPLCDLVDGALLVQVEGSAKLTFTDQASGFTDVPQSAWYAAPVDFVSSRGLFLGVGDNRFDPLGTTTCGMMATVLHRLAGAPASELPQTDPPFGALNPEAYYAQGVAWALACGVVDGTADGFAPEQNITREQLAVMLYRTAGVLGISQESKAPLSTFTDGDDASQFAQAGLRWAVAEGILQGRGDGTLDPTGTATRCEVSAMIQRFVNLILQEA